MDKFKTKDAQSWWNAILSAVASKSVAEAAKIKHAMMRYYERLPKHSSPSRRMSRSKHYVAQPAGSLIEVCPGGRHGWFYTGHGPVRKPINQG